MTRELIVELSIPERLANGQIPLLDRLVEETFFNFLRAQIGKPYDTDAVLGLGIGRNWREPDSWFCSELQAAALEASGYLPKLSAADNHISPRDLLLVLSGRVSIPDAA